MRPGCTPNKVAPDPVREPVQMPWLHAAEMSNPQNSYIEVIGASGIAKADILGSSDPYCVVYWNVRDTIRHGLPSCFH
eukprot:SAG22_NODE_302_length_12743_cov_12.397738_20_plen_78_part_00